jgi:hypothetical protein
MDTKKTSQNLLLSLVASLTLGLAPFSPEPHILGKLRWLLGGAKGMQIQDYGDTLMHGLPWLLFIYFLVQYTLIKIKNK